MKYFSDYNGQGGIKELLTLATPMVISSACDGIMTFTDRLFLARIGSEQMNAAMGGAVALQVLMFFFIGLTGYSTALVAQYFGAREHRNTTVAAFQAMLITLIAWPVILILKPVLQIYLGMMNIPASQFAYQMEYMDVLAWGSVFSLMRYTIGCYFTGIGKTRIVMGATITAMLVNVILDYILIFGKLGLPEMGVRGAAIATNTGSFCAVVVLGFAYLGRANRSAFAVFSSFRFDWTIMKKLLYYGYPAGLEFFLNFLAFSAMVSLFQGQGDHVATATTILFNWDLVSYIPLVGIEIAVTSLVGRYMGARIPDTAYRSAISGIKTGIFYSITVLFFFVFCTETLVRVFSPEQYSPVFELAVPLATGMLRLAALYVLFEAILAATIGALRGAGDTHFTMMASVIGHWTFVPIIYISLNVLKLSVIISWLMMIVFFLIFCITLIFRFRSGKWKNIRVIDSTAS